MTQIHEMLPQRIDFNLFRIFVAVAETGSTGAAARQLHLTQSAVSHALGRLRAQLGDPLFVKQGRNLVLTPHGRAMMPRVQQALSTLDQCRVQPGAFDPSTATLEFHLGFRDILEAMLLPPLMARLSEMGASLRFTSSRVRGSELEDKLKSGELDLAVDMEVPVGDAISSTGFRSEPLAVLVGPTHPAFESGTLDEGAYVASEHVLVTLEPRERAFVEQRMLGVGSRRSVRLHCHTYFAAASVVAQTNLILTMPATYAGRLATLLGLRILPLPFECEPLPVRLYWRRANSDEPSVRWLIDTVSALGQGLDR
ncbi:LysR family transcriptional regulator [Ferrimonas balearica]|uniref:LysR family transcriptional regulator n=1 Tax=Ferrimonas balearica TaxID=44012 RepID=UPI001C9989D1|nr:LysR family transcriptional regulator [Ferrimonas balearica]MBY5920812.1 LysR family transcriptional regulator [Ferrimonas balearica]MBY5996503.1 LysR family transcriptional regulator [Ferrimonas balearica]